MSEEISAARAAALKAYLAGVPFARFLGVECVVRGDEMTAILPFQDKFIGNVALPALHGGAIGALLEVTALSQLLLSGPTTKPAKPVDVSIDYLRSGRASDVFARATITKLGRRVSNVRAEAWQGRRDAPIATLHGHFLMPKEDA